MWRHQSRLWKTPESYGSILVDPVLPGCSSPSIDEDIPYLLYHFEMLSEGLSFRDAPKCGREGRRGIVIACKAKKGVLRDASRSLNEKQRRIEDITEALRIGTAFRSPQSLAAVIQSLQVGLWLPCYRLLLWINQLIFSKFWTQWPPPTFSLSAPMLVASYLRSPAISASTCH